MTIPTNDGRDKSIAAVPPILTQEVAFAADLQWNRPVPAELASAIQTSAKANQSLMQLLDQFPVTLAMQYAVAYGWSLRERLVNRKVT